MNLIQNINALSIKYFVSNNLNHTKFNMLIKAIFFDEVFKCKSISFRKLNTKRHFIEIHVLEIPYESSCW